MLSEQNRELLRRLLDVEAGKAGVGIDGDGDGDVSFDRYVFGYRGAVVGIEALEEMVAREESLKRGWRG